MPWSLRYPEEDIWLQLYAWDSREVAATPQCLIENTQSPTFHLDGP